jgi:Rod binding domain-containing protein
MLNPINQNKNSIPVTTGNQFPKNMTADQKKLAKACSEFESVLVQQMLGAMQGSTKMFGEGFGGSYFQDMFQQELSKKVSVNGLGIAKIMFDQLNRTKNVK